MRKGPLSLSRRRSQAPHTRPCRPASPCAVEERRGGGQLPSGLLQVGTHQVPVYGHPVQVRHALQQPRVGPPTARRVSFDQGRLRPKARSALPLPTGQHPAAWTRGAVCRGRHWRPQAPVSRHAGPASAQEAVAGTASAHSPRPRARQCRRPWPECGAASAGGWVRRRIGRTAHGWHSGSGRVTHVSAIGALPWCAYIRADHLVLSATVFNTRRGSGTVVLLQSGYASPAPVLTFKSHPTTSPANRPTAMGLWCATTRST